MKFVLKMMNFVIKMMNFVHVHVGNPARAGGPKGMNFAVQMMNFAVQMMNSAVQMMNSAVQMMTFKYKTDATARRWWFCCSESDQAGLTVAVCASSLRPMGLV